MSQLFAAEYFDGRTSARHAVDVVVLGGRMTLRGEGVALDFRARDVRFRPRIAGAPMDVDLPDGGLLVAPYETLASALPIPAATDLAHRLEAHVVPVLVALAGLIFGGWLAYAEGIPWLARVVADRLPPQFEADLAKEGLKALDSVAFAATKVPAKERASLDRALAELAGAAGFAPPRLEFRYAPPFIGANAFALPGGIIVVTDQLVDALPSDELVVAVLAHELGHLHHRHGTRRILQASITGLFTAAVFGDASVGTLAATVPTALLTSSYSREQEREADAYAFELLRKSGRSPALFAEALGRLEQQTRAQTPRRPLGAARTGYLSSHPDSRERMKAAQQAVGFGSPTKETP